MAVIAPCITVESEADYRATIERLHPFARRVHIDIMDGQFAPTFSIEVNKLWWPQEWEVDVHAMVANPSQYVQALIELKPHTVIFHAEAQEDLTPSLQLLKAAGIKAGVALLKPTVPNTVRDCIEAADHVLVFCGNLGYYGGTASLMQLEKVRLIRMIHPEVEVGWDGGVNVENAFSLAQGTVDVLNVGGAINKATDPAAVNAQLESEMNKHSVI